MDYNKRYDTKEAEAVFKRTVSFLTGYGLGGFLTAPAVSRLFGGGDIRARGSGNPGMANVAFELGPLAGGLTLAGDAGKTVAALGLAQGLFHDQTARFYASCGTVLGHDFPARRGFSGGEGVACTAVSLPLVDPVRGTYADLVGALTVASTGYLCLGALAIPLTFSGLSALAGRRDQAKISAFMTLVMAQRHRRALARLVRGQEKRHFQVLKR